MERFGLEGKEPTMKESTTQIQRYLEGELDEQEKSWVEQQIEQDHLFQAEFIELQTLQEDLEVIKGLFKEGTFELFDEKKVFQQLSKVLDSLEGSKKRIPEQEKRSLPWWLGWGGGSLGAFVAAATALLIFMLQPTIPKVSNPPFRRSKGGISFKMYCLKKAEKKVTICQNKTKLSLGDAVQFELDFSEKSHFMVISINQQGYIAPFWPYFSLKNRAGDSVKSLFYPSAPKLSPAFGLDNYWGKELFVVWRSTTPFSFATLNVKLGAEFQQVGEQLSALQKRLQNLGIKTILIHKQRRTEP